jgi:hypothetical protein
MNYLHISVISGEGFTIMLIRNLEAEF